MKNQIIKRAALCVVFLFTIMLGAAYKAIAQGAVDKVAHTMTDSLAYLNLTDAQKPQALGFNKTAAASLAQLVQKAKTDTTLKGKVMAQQVMGIMKQRNASLKKILTPDQTKIYQQHQVQQMAELQTKMMSTQLDLTDAQLPQVYAVNLKYTQKMMADVGKVQESTRKLQKAKAAKGLKSDSGDEDNEIKKILTADQYAKYEKNKQEMQAAMKEKMQEKKAAKG